MGAVSCQNCGSERIASVSAKCSDACHYRLGGQELDYYVPSDLGIGGGDYVEFKYCLDCGQIQGDFPIPQAEVDEAFGDD